MAIQNIEYTDNARQGTDKIVANFGQTLNKGLSGGLYDTIQLHQIPGLLNEDSTPVEFLNLGSVGTHAGDNIDRVLLPKGFVAINWSQNFVLNWKWNDVTDRAEPFDTDFAMIGTEFGGEGFLVHYTIPGGIPATHFHEILRLGGGIDGLSGVDPYTTHIPFNQFKSTIYACYRATTTPDAATEHPWWGGSGNTLESVLNPLLWLNTEETKGSGYNLNELAKFSAYGSVYPAVNFEKSNGTYDSKTIVATDTAMGRIGSNVYDGSAFQNTAAITFLTRGTMSAGNAGQSIAFVTSPTNTAGLLTRAEVTNDGAFKFFIPLRSETGTVTGVPSYTTVGFTPALTGSTTMQSYVSSTVSGGASILGFSNNTAGAFPLALAGVHGHTSPTTPAVFVAGRKHNGGTDWTTLASGEIVFQIRNHTTVLMEVLGSGNMGFGATTPTALVHCGASSTARAGLRVVPGAAPTTGLQNGDIWIDSTAHTMHVRINGVTKSIDLT